MYTVVLLAAVAGVSSAPSCYGYHGMMPLRHGTASIQGEKLQVQLYEFKHVQESVNVKRKVKNKEGKEEEVTMPTTVTKVVTMPVLQEHRPEDVRVLDSNRRDVSGEEAIKLLAKPRRVVIANEREPIDPVYMSLLRKETIVLVLPLIAVQPKGVPPKSARSDAFRPDLFTALQGKQPPAGLKAPTSMPPKAARATIDDTGRVRIEETITHSFERTGYYSKEVNGKPNMVPFALKNTTTTKAENVLDLRWVTAHDVTGKLLDRSIVSNVLRRPTAVLLSSDYKQVDPYYLEVFHDNALVLVLPIPDYPEPQDFFDDETIVPEESPSKK